MENKYLLYIGKTNKKFTHNVLYNYSCGGYSGYPPSNITVHTDEKCLINFNYNPENRKKKRYLEKNVDYFFKNFKFIDEIEYLRYCRKQKLQKLKTNR
jgi:hypothetical protein